MSQSSANPGAPPPARRHLSAPICLAAAALAVAWCVYLAFFGPKESRGPLPQPLLRSTTAPTIDYRWKLRDMDGKPVDFGQFRGKPVFVNIWATWCPPCVAELPAIDRLASNPRVKDVAVVCISVDDEHETVAAFVKRQKLGARVLHAAEPPPRAFRTEGIPATFVIDHQGRIVMSEVGAAQWDAPEVAEYLEKLAAGEAR